MADLDELSDREDYPVSSFLSCEGFLHCSTFCWLITDMLHLFQEVENAEAENLEEDADDNVPDPKSLDLDSVSKLQKTQRYKDIMQVSQLFLGNPCLPPCYISG